MLMCEQGIRFLEYSCQRGSCYMRGWSWMSAAVASAVAFAVAAFVAAAADDVAAVAACWQLLCRGNTCWCHVGGNECCCCGCCCRCYGCCSLIYGSFYSEGTNFGITLVAVIAFTASDVAFAVAAAVAAAAATVVNAGS